MRALALIPLFVLAACSDTGGGDPEAPAKTAAAATLEAGQWEVTTEVTRLTATDSGAPAVKTPAGTKSTATACVAETDRKRPPAALFAATGETCEYQNFYMSRGRLNATMKCTRPGLNGELLRSLDGNFTAATLEGTGTMETYSSGDGDFSIAFKLSGRQAGACVPA